MKKYIEITIAVPDQSSADMAIAIMSELPMEGIEELGNELKVYFSEEQFDGDRISGILSGLNLKFKTSEQLERNWNQEWESGFEPVVIDDFAGIRANFHERIQGVTHEIIITPKMSFGTGHHATTSMMIKMMRKLNLKNKSVLDFGTGTGVLAILAAKCGAVPVTAIDNDEWSIENAKENISTNNLN